MNGEILNKIRDFADQAHGEQMRKYTSERYIVHPVRVMELCRNYTGKGPVLAAALLHDVLEDTGTSREDILHFLKGVMEHGPAQETLKLVIELTDEYEKRYYPQWNRNKRKAMEAERMANISADAQTVKYADIIDNALEIVEKDPGFSRKFLQECRVLLEKMTKGHPGLRHRALQAVMEYPEKKGKNKAE